MKKSLLLIATAAVLFSCKKKEDNNFEATDMTGNTTVQGLVTRSIGGNTTPMANATVLVKVRNNGLGGLYPNSSAVGSEVYSTTTNAMGKYSLSVKTNGTGVDAEITFNGFSMANDTAMSAVVYDYPTTVYNTTLYKSLNATQNHNYTGSAVVTPANQGVGTATVSGVLYMNRRAYTTAANTVNSPSATPVANQTIYLEYDKDPMTLSKKIYTTTTSATGRYTFVVTTPNTPNLPGFNDMVKVYVPAKAMTEDSVRFNGTVITGKQGVYAGGNSTYGPVYSTINKNNLAVTYGAFTPDL